MMYVQKIKFGRPTYLNSDEEALVVASAEIEGAHGLTIDVNTLGVKLQLVIKAVNNVRPINQRDHIQGIIPVYPLGNQAR